MELSDTKVAVIWREPGSSRGMSISKGGPTNQVVPYAFSNHASSPQIGYKLPLSSDLVRYSTRLERRNDDIPRKATPCRICPQYGHALIFPRKCYYEAQCPLPLLFCANHHGERPVRTSSRAVVASTHPKFPTLVRPFLRRLSSTLSKRLAKNDPNKVRTNFGWMKRDEVPYHLRHERGSQ